MIRSLAVLALAGVLSGCNKSVVVRSPAGVPAYSVVDDAPEVRIPPGHMPPPGGCRPWYPGAPPGRQPPPGDCDELLHSAPAEAWVLYRPTEERRVVRIG
jgi:hypothetical protein